MTKRTIAYACVLLFAGAGISISAQAQEKTRAQVRADLIRVEQAGYNPGNYDPYYPEDIQAAEAKVAAQDAAGNDRQMAAESVGGTPQFGSSAAGKASEGAGSRSIYFGQ